MIEVRQLTKRFGRVTAVDSVSFTVQPGIVTGFLGPNGAGKSTTMRMIAGLDRPTSGETFVNGAPFSSARAPLATLGAMLEARNLERGRSAFNHLLAIAAYAGMGEARVHEVAEFVGLGEVLQKKAVGFSLGMSQRLGIAAALIGNPRVLMFDEPVNGLDPDGISWIRNVLKDLAAEGRTVLVSSHLMSEMEQTADHLIVIGKGRVLADTSMKEFIAASSQHHVRVVSPDIIRLGSLLSAQSGGVTTVDETTLSVVGVEAATVGRMAAEHGIELHQLVDVAPSLEDAFFELTNGAVEFRATHATQGARK